MCLCSSTTSGQGYSGCSGEGESLVVHLIGGGVAARQVLLLSCSLTKSGLCPDLPLLLAEQTLLHQKNAQQKESSDGDTKLIEDDTVCWFNYRRENLCSHQNLFQTPEGKRGTSKCLTWRGEQVISTPLR